MHLRTMINHLPEWSLTGAPVGCNSARAADVGWFDEACDGPKLQAAEDLCDGRRAPAGDASTLRVPTPRPREPNDAAGVHARK